VASRAGVVPPARTSVSFDVGGELARGVAIVALGDATDAAGADDDGGIEVASYSRGFVFQPDALARYLYERGGIAPRTGIPYMVAGGALREAVVRSTRDNVAFVAFVDDRFHAHAPKLWAQPQGVTVTRTRDEGRAPRRTPSRGLRK
jgi:hypothetical protein